MSIEQNQPKNISTEPTDQCDHPIIWVNPNFGAASTRKSLLEFFKYNIQHCPNCGELIPELKIQLKDKTYTFTCYEVREFEEQPKDKNGFVFRADSKIVLETDYRKLRAYLEAYGK
jgi:hypothetical protein